MTKRLGQILIDAGIINQTTLERALKLQSVSGMKFGEVLERMGIVLAEDVVEMLEMQQRNNSLVTQDAELIDLQVQDHKLEPQQEIATTLNRCNNVMDMPPTPQGEDYGTVKRQKSIGGAGTKKFGEILVEAGIITNSTLVRALERQQESGKILGDILEDMGVITHEEVMQALAVQNGKLVELLADPRRQYRRFERKHIILHLLVITSFLGLALTGMPLKFSDQNWAKFLMNFLGGAESAGHIHRFCAILTFVYFSTAMVMSFHFLFIRKDIQGSWLQRLTGPDSFCPNMKDVRDIVGMTKWFFFRGPKPSFERWAYWEKFDFMAVFWGMLAIGCSGMILWFPELFGRFLPGWMINVATIVHSDEALLATGFIFTVHFFNTHGRPEKFPMDFVIFNGQLSKYEFIEERGEQWRRYERLGILSQYEVHRPSSAFYDFVMKGFGFAALFTGLGILFLMVLAFIYSMY